MRVWPGSPSPRGATFDGKGVNFSVFSSVATRVEVCLFDARESGRDGATGSRRPRSPASIWCKAARTSGTPTCRS